MPRPQIERRGSERSWLALALSIKGENGRLIKRGGSSETTRLATFVNSGSSRVSAECYT